MKKILKCFKNLLFHFVGYVTAAYLAGMLANLLLNTLSVSSENIELTVKGVINAAFILGAFFFIRKRLNDDNTEQPHFFSKTSLATLLLAVCAISVIVALLYGLDLYEIQARQNTNEILFVLAALIAQSLTQEVLFRGILFHGFSKHYSTLTVAVILSAVFALLTMLVKGLNLLPFLSAFFISFILCMLFYWRKSLLLNALVNASWLYVTFLTGVLDEHWNQSAPFITQPYSEALFSGGKFGPASSIFGLIFLASCAFWLYKKHINFHPSSS